MENGLLLKDFKTLEESSSFLSKNFTSLQKKFADKFIVVKGTSVLSSSDSFEEIEGELNKKKINPEEVVVQFIPREGQIILY